MSFAIHSVDAQWETPVRIFKLEGQLDSKTIAELETFLKVEKSRDDKRAWVMDLSRLSYISSAGVAIFIGLGYEAEGKGGLCFFGATPKVASVFELLGLTDVFRFYGNEEAARAQSGL